MIHTIWNMQRMYGLVCIVSFTIHASVTVKATVGFEGVFITKRWIPVTVEVHNQGKPVSGTLEIVVTSGSEFQHNIYPTRYTTPVELGHGVKKLYGFTVLIDNVIHDLGVRLRHDSAVLYENNIDMRSHAITRQIVGIADSTISSDMTIHMPDSFHAVVVPPSKLPYRWYGYEPVKTILINPHILSTMDNSRYEALKTWIQKGGSIIIYTDNSNSLYTARIHELIPVTVNGLVLKSNLSSLEQWCSIPFLPHEEILVNHVTAPTATAQTIIIQDSLPLVIQNQFHNGTVILLTFDIRQPFFALWEGKKQFWEKIIQLLPQRFTPQPLCSDYTIISALIDQNKDTFSTFMIVIPMLFVYSVLLYIIVTKIKHHNRYHHVYTWGLVITIVIFLILSSVFYIWRERTSFLTSNDHCQVIQEQDSNASIAHAQRITGVYSLEPFDYHLCYNAEPAPIVPLLYEKTLRPIPDPLTYISSAEGQCIAVEASNWSANFFRTSFAFRNQFTARHSFADDGLSIVLHNQSSRSFYNCFIYWSGLIVAVDTVEPGEKVVAADTSGAAANLFSSSDAYLDIVYPDLSLKQQKFQKRVTREYINAMQKQDQSQEYRFYFLGWFDTETAHGYVAESNNRYKTGDVFVFTVK